MSTIASPSRGAAAFQLDSRSAGGWFYFSAAMRRLVRGPIQPGWSHQMEAGTSSLRRLMRRALEAPDAAKGRSYLQAWPTGLPKPMPIKTEFVEGPVRGEWYLPEETSHQLSVLYLHGGGFGYYPRFETNLAALVATACKLRTFALDYRLAPEHAYPAQIEDALAAYRWLMDSGNQAEKVVLAGDGAGGNLALAMMIALREAGEPMPRLAVCLSPWTDLSNIGEEMIPLNQPYDWLEERMLERWRDWYCQDNDPKDPMISPVRANLGGLPPIFIQVGDAEVLFDRVHIFKDVARKQGAEVALEVWEHMNHLFQLYGDSTQQSKMALGHIAKAIERTNRDKN